MSERIELEDIPKQMGDSLENNSTDGRAVTGNENGDHLAHNTQERPEEMSLLGEDIVQPLPQHAEDNSVVVNDHHQAADGRKCVTRSVWEELKKPIVWNLRLWMVLAIIFGVILLVIVLSLVFCSVLYEDEDEKFNKGSFLVPRLYTGTFRLVNQNFTVGQLKNGSLQMQDLSSQLQKMLADLYTSSPALGRYFSSARVSNFSEGSVTAHYWLHFVMPEEHGELVRYTLSTRMVRGILRQHLYEPQPWAPLYIDPETVRVTVGNNTQN